MLNIFQEKNLKKDSLSIGAYIQGQIKIRTYEVSMEDIGGVLNLVGNLLNEGNTVALFTTIEIINNIKMKHHLNFHQIFLRLKIA